MTVTTAPRPTDARPALSQRRPRRADEVIAPIASWLTMHSVTALRISLGLIIFGFGMLKYFPGASPAEPLVMRTVDALTFGLVSGTPAVVATAVVETLIGLTLITGLGLRVGLVALAGAGSGNSDDVRRGRGFARDRGWRGRRQVSVQVLSLIGPTGLRST
jgi:putative oxidoreductase